MHNPDMTFISTADTPLISSLDAQNVITDGGVPLVVSGQLGGRSMTITAIHGLATFGIPDGKPDSGGCIGWIGPCNYPVFHCVKGQGCTPTGMTIPRLENRPMWIIDVAGASFVGSGASFNHTVYAVDEMTKTVLFTWGYDGP